MNISKPGGFIGKAYTTLKASWKSCVKIRDHICHELKACIALPIQFILSKMSLIAKFRVT